MRPLVVLVILALSGAALGACANSGIPQDGRYQTHGGGWDNWRG